MTHADWIPHVRVVGTLAGDPVEYLLIDSIDHPTLPRAHFQLNGTRTWIGWRGRWAQPLRDWRQWLTGGPWPEADASEVWDLMTYPEAQ